MKVIIIVGIDKFCDLVSFKIIEGGFFVLVKFMGVVVRWLFREFVIFET